MHSPRCYLRRVRGRRVRQDLPPRGSVLHHRLPCTSVGEPIDVESRLGRLGLVPRPWVALVGRRSAASLLSQHANASAYLAQSFHRAFRGQGGLQGHTCEVHASRRRGSKQVLQQCCRAVLYGRLQSVLVSTKQSQQVTVEKPAGRAAFAAQTHSPR